MFDALLTMETNIPTFTCPIQFARSLKTYRRIDDIDMQSTHTLFAHPKLISFDFDACMQVCNKDCLSYNTALCDNDIIAGELFKTDED